jgi:hypothetical protein
LRRILEYSPSNNSDNENDESDEGIFFSQTKYQSGSEDSVQYEDDCEIQMILNDESAEVIDLTNDDDDDEIQSEYEEEDEEEDVSSVVELCETDYDSDWSTGVDMEEEML